MLAQIEKDFPNDVRVVFRHYPLIGTPEQPFHDKAAISAQSAEAAGRQGKFWEMHDVIFSKQGEWKGMTVAQYTEWAINQAVSLGMDKAKFTKDLTDPEIVSFVQNAWEDAKSKGIPGTPFLLLNGQIWPNNVPMDYNSISAIIKLKMLEKRQFTQCPPMTIDTSKQYIATLHTTKGDIVIELYDDQAPLAVNSFIFLAKNGWFDNAMFHRVIPGFVAQTGDPTGSGYGGPGYAFDNEIDPNLKFDKAGVVGMANAGAGSNGSQFFITYGPQDKLTGGYTIFGQVISGMDVAEKLTARDPSKGGALPEGDYITSVTIEEK